MNNHPIAIRINGQAYTEEELISLISTKLSLSHLPEWENELLRFLEEWFSSAETIQAQTSGSTGEPQIIRLPKTIMLQSASRTIEYFGLQTGNRMLLCLPCRYIAGKMMVVRAILGKMDLIAVDPSSDFIFLSNELFDFGAMVPNQVFKLLESPLGKEKVENICHLLVGGSSISSTLEAQISQLSNHVVSTYGMTETASHIAIRELSGKKHSDIYNCLPGITVTTDENDCLKIHVPESVQPLQTNDVAEIISPHSFRILGRTDDVIISGGIKYWPDTIEKKLQHMIPNRFVISSFPDEKLGKKLVLVIEGEPASTDSLQDELKTLLFPYEQPKSIFFLDHFPETPNGKVKRNEIKEAIRRF
jgi:o-succinylbenzoate---CoA ligase